MRVRKSSDRQLRALRRRLQSWHDGRQHYLHVKDSRPPAGPASIFNQRSSRATTTGSHRAFVLVLRFCTPVSPILPLVFTCAPLLPRNRYTLVPSPPDPRLLSVMRTPVALPPHSNKGAAPCNVATSKILDHCKIGLLHSPGTCARRRHFCGPASRKTNCSGRRVRPMSHPTWMIGPTRPDYGRQSDAKRGTEAPWTKPFSETMT
jgi:hypothetical protein